VGTRREALFASVILAVSYHHIWFSQNARGYVILAWCALAGAWLLLRLLSSGQPRFAVGFAVVTALGAYTHLTMVFIAVGQALAVLGHLVLSAKPEERRKLAWPSAGAFIGAAAGTVLCYLPALPLVLDHFLNRPSQLVGISTPAWALAETARVLAAGFGAGNPYLGAVVLSAGMVIGLTGVLSLWRSNRTAAALFLVPVGTILAGALLARGTMYPRFFFALAGFAILIGVRGILVVSEWVGARLGAGHANPLRSGAAIMVVVVAASLWSLQQNYRFPKQDFVGALAHIDASAAPGDTIAVIGVTDFAFNRYLGREAAVVTNTASLAELRRRQAVWIAWAFPRYLAASAPEILSTLNRQCTLTKSFRGTVGGGEVHVCRLEPDP
jgi:mannosyltransferase